MSRVFTGYAVYGRRVRSSVWLSSAFLLLLFVGLRVSAMQAVEAYTNFKQSSVVSAIGYHPASHAAAQSPTPIPTHVVASAGAVTTSCTPDTSYHLPGGLDLSAATDGLTEQRDSAHTYVIYGNDGSTVRRQIISCAPKLGGGEDYTGYTVYNLSWRYNYTLESGSQCTLSSVKVGLHINQVLPAWHAQASTSAAFTAAWQTFAANLRTHEEGHVVLDEQYATQLVHDLQQASAADCDTLAQVAKGITDTDVTALNTANTNYDASTNHGATQGAILP